MNPILNKLSLSSSFKHLVYWIENYNRLYIFKLNFNVNCWQKSSVFKL